MGYVQSYASVKEKDEAIGEGNIKRHVDPIFGDFIWSTSPNDLKL